jgi:hypothetical protein
MALSVACLAQSVGSVTGLITDVSGASVAGASITLTGDSTGLVSRTESNDAGIYSFPSALVGGYTLRVEKAGFKSLLRTSIILETGQALRLDLALELGATQETISVTGELPLLEQEKSSVGTAVNQTMLNALPFQLGGSMRNPFAFLRLTPGAVGNSGSGGDTRIAGGRGLGSEVFVDGVQVTYNAAQSVADVAHPPYDTISEFRVESVLPPAEHGRTSGGVVLMTSRSGTNEYRGNVLMLLRNNIFDARRYNARIADITRQAEFAGSIGGPITIPKLYSGRNRSFFFANYTGFRRASLVQGATSTVATEAMRRGDFSQNAERIFDPMTAAANGQRQQFPGNVIPGSRLSPLTRQLMSIIPLPNAPGFAANYLGVNDTGDNTNSGFIRIDHQLAQAHRLSATFRHQDRFRLATNGPLPLTDQIEDGPLTKNGSLGHDWIITPSIVNRFQFGLTWFQNDRRETIADLGLQVPGAFRAGYPASTFGGQGMSQLGYDQSRTPTNFNWNIQESLSWTQGKHNFKFGARYDEYITNFKPVANEEGTYNYSQFATSQPLATGTGHSFASFALGLVNSATLARVLAQKDESKYWAIFAQDDWKLTKRLTLNYGVRYEMQMPWQEPLGRTSIMDPATPNPGANGRLGALIFAGDGAGRIGGKRFMQTDRNNISPRFGFALQLTPKTILRGGYGIFFAPLIGQDIQRQGFNTNLTIASTDGGLTPVFQLDSGFPAGVVRTPPFIDPTVANGTATSAVESRRGGSGSMPRTQQWQMNVQRTVWDILLDGSYVATLGHGITNGALVQLNQLTPDRLALGSLLTRQVTDPLVAAAGFGLPYPSFRGTLAQSLRAFPQYQGVNVLDAPAGNSTYHAFLFKAEKRFSNGLQFLASYAFSKTITDVSFIDSDLAAPQDTYNRRAEKSIANTDIPNRLVLSYNYELPFGKGKRWASSGKWNWLVGGWSASGIHTYQSGSPIRVTTTNGLPIFNGHLRPNRVGDVPIRIGPGFGEFQPLNALTGQQGDLFLDRSAFAAPAPFTFGNLGVFLPDIRGFAQRGEDISAVKRFRIREKLRTEFRADFFNAFNRRNLNNPVSDITNANFGRITGAGAARVIQFGWRMDF